MGRIREVSSIDLPTSGHMLSHNLEEIRALLANQDLSNILVLDDTSFSGSTSLIFEKLLRAAFSEKKMDFTHGFLILNQGKLGSNPGAKERLGAKAFGGREMVTPKDDGWHFFDLVKQGDIANHLLVLSEILKLIGRPNFPQLANAILADEKTLRLMFPQVITAREILELQSTGHFIGQLKTEGGFQVRNPQLLPNIIGQKHLLPPSEWRGDRDEVFELLLALNQLLAKGSR